MAMLRDKVPFRGVRHEAANPVLFINDEGEPSVLSFLTVVQVHDPDDAVMKTLPRVLDHALVTDVMRKGEDGVWRVARRTFEQMIRAYDRDPDEAGWRQFQKTAAQRATERQGK